MEKKITMPVIFFKEQVNKKEYFVAHCPIVDVSSQGKTEEEAKENIKEALSLYFEQPEAKKIIDGDIGVHIVNISQEAKHAQTSNTIRA